MTTQVRSHFDRELARLVEGVLDMGSRARHAYAASLRALQDNDVELAGDVIAGDLTINEIRFRIEKQCYAMLVMEQPVAGDMRAIVSALTISNEIERIGDHAKRIAKLTLRMANEPRTIPLTDIVRMGEAAMAMLDRALGTYGRCDLEEARAICAQDDHVDALYKQTFNVTLSYMLENTRAISLGTYLIQIAHELERVGDRATNIAERVIYALTGELIDLNV